MIRKILLGITIIGLILSFGKIAAADDTLEDRVPSLKLQDAFSKIEGLDSGFYWSLKDEVLNYSATIKAFEYKDFALNLGYAGQAQNTSDKFIGALSYDMFALKDYINVPILDLIQFDPYVCGGNSRG